MPVPPRRADVKSQGFGHAKIYGYGTATAGPNKSAGFLEKKRGGSGLQLSDKIICGFESARQHWTKTRDTLATMMDAREKGCVRVLLSRGA